MSNIHVTSEIGKLKKVLLHRPGNELLNLTPDTLGRLLKIVRKGSRIFEIILDDQSKDAIKTLKIVAKEKEIRLSYIVTNTCSNKFLLLINEMIVLIMFIGDENIKLLSTLKLTNNCHNIIVETIIKILEIIIILFSFS